QPITRSPRKHRPPLESARSTPGCARARWAPSPEARHRPTARGPIAAIGCESHGSLTLAAWSRIEEFDQSLNSLMVTDDWDAGEVHWQLSDKGEMILGVRHGGGNDFSLAVLGPSDLGRWVHMVTIFDAQRKAVLHDLDGKPVSRRDRQLDLADGQGQPVPQPERSDGRIRELR